MAHKFGLNAGFAYDLLTYDETGEPWDFDKKCQREKCMRHVMEKKPQFLIGSPMCTAFSNIQNLNKMRRDPAVIEKEYEKARVHLKWCCRLYQAQIDRGAYFLHEHPAGATSWKLPEVLEVLAREGVRRIVADQCQFGQQTDTGDPLKKPTGFMSNADELLKTLDKRCFGKGGLCTRPKGGRHAECLGKKAQRAAIFQDELCLAILRGFKAQLIADRRMRPGEVGVIQDGRGAVMDGDDEVKTSWPSGPRNYHDGEEEWACFTPHHDRYVDDLTGLPLPPELCRAARQKELDYFRSKGVWEIKNVNEARAKMGRRPISVRWVETNKGDDENPNMRSRLVAR